MELVKEILDENKTENLQEYKIDFVHHKHLLIIKTNQTNKRIRPVSNILIKIKIIPLEND